MSGDSSQDLWDTDYLLSSESREESMAEFPTNALNPGPLGEAEEGEEAEKEREGLDGGFEEQEEQEEQAREEGDHQKKRSILKGTAETNGVRKKVVKHVHWWDGQYG
ncbi:hypothetical protein L13192_08613 [Pyrenophora tritici-repentis]|nr:hypothetical protein L13192_08613 [Pyrenophora tritici-repentis]